MSQTAMTNTFDQLDDVLTGRKAAEQKALELRNDLMKIEIDAAKANSTAGLASPSLAGSVIPARFPTPQMKGVPEPDFITTTALRAINSPSLPSPKLGLSYNSTGEIVSDMVESPTQTYVGKDGLTAQVPVGPDLDEMASGFFINKYLQFKSWGGLPQLKSTVSDAINRSYNDVQRASGVPVDENWKNK
jgi:hypothetical protein